MGRTEEEMDDLLKAFWGMFVTIHVFASDFYQSSTSLNNSNGEDECCVPHSKSNSTRWNYWGQKSLLTTKKKVKNTWENIRAILAIAFNFIQQHKSDSSTTCSVLTQSEECHLQNRLLKRQIYSPQNQYWLSSTLLTYGEPLSSECNKKK